MDWPFLVETTALVLLPQLWIARCYSRLPIGQDEGLWLLWGVTGAKPYREHVDCKPPGVHLWGWLLARLTRGNVRGIKRLHHGSLAAMAIIVAVAFDNVWAGVVFGMLAQSVWLHGNHAWVEQLSAVFLALALASDGWATAVLLAGAIFFNLKLALPATVLVAGYGLWLEGLVTGLAGIVLVLGTWTARPALVADLWYACVTVPRRLVASRRMRGQRWLPERDPVFAAALLVVVPPVLLALADHPDAILWLSALTYLGVNATGRVWRPYHLIPLAAYAAAGATPAAAVIAVADWLAAGFYTGDVISRLRPLVGRGMQQARCVGRFLRDRAGSVHVTDEFTQIYVYAGKRPWQPLVEQVEIRDVVTERRRARSANAPDFLVFGPGTREALPRDYRAVFVHGDFTVIEPLAESVPHIKRDCHGDA